jgi:hypothetical protein
MLTEARFYFVCILGLLVLSLVAISYLPPEKNVPIVLVIGFVALIMAQYKGAADVREALKIANAIKAEHVQEIMEKVSETHSIIKNNNGKV